MKKLRAEEQGLAGALSGASLRHTRQNQKKAPPATGCIPPQTSGSWIPERRHTLSQMLHTGKETSL